MASHAMPHRARRIQWLELAGRMPPEALASHIQADDAAWVVVTEQGDAPDVQRHTAYLSEAADLPFWAFALAKSYLDDVGEWPLTGLATESALERVLADGLEGDAAVRLILGTLEPVWPDVRVVFVGREQGEGPA
ncbi:MAG: hypothetical protein H7831_01675 [Magnetococcus sp. WYHC-3]